MRKRDVKRLVDWVLMEFDDGGGDDWGGDWAWDAGMGYGGGGGAGLYSTFLQPFVDVVDTAAAVAETGMSKVQLLVGIATYGLMDILIPFVKPKYEAMVKHDKHRMASIYQKHKDTFARTDQALTEVGGNYDGAGVFFVLFPDAVITHNLGKMAVGGSEKTVKMAADTVFDFLDTVTFNATGRFTDAVRKTFNFQESFERGHIVEAEDDDDGEAEKLAKVTMKVITSPKVKKMVAGSKAIKSLKADGFDAIAGTLEEATEPIRQLKQVKSLQQLESLTGKKLDVDGAMRQKKVDPKAAAIEPQDVDAAVQDVLPGLIEQAAQPFVKRLEYLKESLTKLASNYGVADSAEFRKLMGMFDEAFAELKST